MKIRNYEFKARVDDPREYENSLLTLDPEFRGTDLQTDTYFNVKQGRLKLREGNNENALISYHREDTAGSKLSEVVFYRHAPDAALKEILVKQFGITKEQLVDRSYCDLLSISQGESNPA